MLHLRIDPACGVPVFRQTSDPVRDPVAAGRSRGGDQLPLVRELARDQAFHPIMVVKACGGRVVGNRRGTGAFIPDGSSALNGRERAHELRGLMQRVAVGAIPLGAPTGMAARLLTAAMDCSRRPGATVHP